MALPYLFIERYQISAIKEIASFAKGLQKDIEAVENAVASEKSNGFVEGTNSRLKMIKRTMYNRCSRQLLSAKLIIKMLYYVKVRKNQIKILVIKLSFSYFHNLRMFQI